MAHGMTWSSVQGEEEGRDLENERMGVCLSIEGPAKLFVSLGQYIFFLLCLTPISHPSPFPVVDSAPMT